MVIFKSFPIFKTRRDRFLLTLRLTCQTVYTKIDTTHKALKLNAELQLKYGSLVRLNLDPKIRKLEIQVFRQAKHHNRKDLNILLAIPGVGETLTIIILSEIHQIDRFPSVQDFSSYARLVKCGRSSAGKKSGDGNQKIGNPYLKWAFGEIITKARITSPVVAKFYQRF